MDNFRRVMAYYDKDNLPETAVPLADGEKGWAKGVYIPIDVYDKAEFLNKRAKGVVNTGTQAEPNILVVEGELAIINNEKEYIQYLYGKCALCDVDNVNNYIYDYVQNQGFGIYMNSNLYGTTYQMCIFVPGYINGSQYICTFNSFYTHKYVYVPIAILNGNNKTILSNNTFYNCPGAAREVIGQSNTEYPIYIEPFVS